MSSHILSRASLQALGCKQWLPLNGTARDLINPAISGTLTNVSNAAILSGERAAQFTGNGHITNIGHVVKTIGNSFTIVGLCKYDANASYGQIYRSMATSNNRNITISTTNTDFTVICGNDTDQKIIAQQVPYGEYYHFALRHSTSETTLFINGILVSSIAGNTLDLVNHTLEAIGYYPYSSTYYYNGILKDFAIFSGCLSDRIIQQLYAATRILPDIKPPEPEVQFISPLSFGGTHSLSRTPNSGTITNIIDGDPNTVTYYESDGDTTYTRDFGKLVYIEKVRGMGGTVSSTSCVNTISISADGSSWTTLISWHMNNYAWDVYTPYIDVKGMYRYVRYVKSGANWHRISNLDIQGRV